MSSRSSSTPQSISVLCFVRWGVCKVCKEEYDVCVTQILTHFSCQWALMFPAGLKKPWWCVWAFILASSDHHSLASIHILLRVCVLADGLSRMRYGSTWVGLQLFKHGDIVTEVTHGGAASVSHQFNSCFYFTSTSLKC